VIYGYDTRTVNEYGLKEMREVTIAATPELLRTLASYIREAAEQLEKRTSPSWHAHAPMEPAQDLGCDVVVMHESS
jgi:hypothetical protein